MEENENGIGLGLLFFFFFFFFFFRAEGDSIMTAPDGHGYIIDI